MKTSKCESCGAEIVWMKDQDGTTLPVNKVRVRAYWIVSEGLGRFMEEATPDRERTALNSPRRRAQLFHVSHFTTCPKAGVHSRHRQRRAT